MVKEILKIISELNESNSSKYKEQIIAQYATDDDFRKVLFYTYNDMYQYYMSPKSLTSMPQGDGISLEGLFNLLDCLRTRRMKASDANLFAANMSVDEFELFSMILDRDLKSQVSAKTINKGLNESFIPQVSYMRCSLPAQANEIKYPAISQLKSDGMFVNIVVKNGEVSIISRNGKPIILKGLMQSFNKPEFEGLVFNGELLVEKDGSPLPRQIGNGLLSSLAKRATTEQSIEDKLVGCNAKQYQKLMKDLKDRTLEWEDTDAFTTISLWDYIPYDLWATGTTFKETYEARFNKLQSLIKNIANAKIIESKVVNSYDEAMEHYQEMRDRGEEGTIVKNLDGFWENKTSKNQIKMKAEKEVELLVTGWKPGTGEFELGIGSLVCQSSCGRLTVNVSGLKRPQRGLEPVDPKDMTKGLQRIKDFKLDCYTGSIITVRFNEVIQNANGEWSLFLPRLIEVRDDKNVADDLEYIKNV